MTSAYGPASTLFVVLLEMVLPETNTRRSPALSRVVGRDHRFPSFDVAQNNALVRSSNQVTTACVEFAPIVHSRPDWDSPDCDTAFGEDQSLPSADTAVLIT